MLASQRLFILSGVTAVLLLGLIYHNFGQDTYSLRDLTSMHKGNGGESRFQSPAASPKIVHNFFSTVAQPITADYTDTLGKKYELPQALHWSKPLGKRVLIVDIDTRLPDKENELFHEKPMDWPKHETKGGGLVSNGIMNHYLYAQIHGYDYKYYQAQHMDGYYDTWIRPHILASLLKNYDFVITLDADVTATHLEVPFEWLFNHWNITSRTSIAMPWDVEERRDNGDVISADSKGVQVFNAGFLIVQNLPHTFEMLKAWGECPTEVRYKGCAHWKQNWSHEQRAFSEYIRYDFNPHGDNIVPIPCDDAMSWPGAPEEFPGRIISNCHGNFFRHHTLNKDKPKMEFQDSVMQLMVETLQNQVKQNLDTVWMKEEKEVTEKVKNLERNAAAL